MTSSNPDVPAQPEDPERDNTKTNSRFVFVVCNPRSQDLCKKEIATGRPDLLPSFSRPGFLTYKTSKDYPDRFDLPLTFGRTFGWSLQTIKSSSIPEVAACIGRTVDQQSASHIHVWSRSWDDHATIQDGESDSALDRLISDLRKSKKGPAVNQVAKPDERIVDVIEIDSGHWCIGWHVAGSITQRWPGGIPRIHVPDPMVSRAYLKTSEALLWSGINLSRIDVCAEIGSAPGGSCQRLLESGAKVIAIDPADLDPSIAENRRVTHLKMRGRDVPHKSLAKVSWLLADSNAAPKQTLDTVDALVHGSSTHFRGLILTLKFPNMEFDDALPSYADRVRSWGFSFVKTRQLAYGRQEVCLMALKQKSVRRFRG